METFHFDTSYRTKELLLKYLFQSPDSKEKRLIKYFLLDNSSSKMDKELLELLKYAPEPFISHMKHSLEEIKKITTTF